METSQNVRTVENDVVLKSLIGGTLVKYDWQDSKFAKESSRREIHYVCYSDFGGLMIETAGPGRLEIRDTNDFNPIEINGVLYLEGRTKFNGYFAFAPKGTIIPQTHDIPAKLFQLFSH